MAGWLRLVWLILAQVGAQDPTCWDGDFTEALCCDKTFGPRGHEGCWDGIHTFERCCGVQQDCWNSDFEHEKCCDLVKGDSGDEACWSGAQTFEYCCSGNRTRPVTGDEPLEELPSFGEGCWDAKHSLTFSRCCIPEMKESCFEGPFSYERCCLGLSPIRRYFMDLPREHELVSCLRESLEGPVKASANISIEECDGKYIHVSRVNFRTEDVMDDFWWQRPQDEVSGHKSVAPEMLHHAGSLCVPTTCSEAAVAGWFASMVDIERHPPSYRMLNASYVRVSPLNARRRPYPSFNGSWLMWRPQTNAPLRKQHNLHQSYFEFVLHEHPNWRQLRLSAETQMVLLALALPVVLASLLRSLGVEAAQPLALQSNLKKLVSPRHRCFDLCRIVTTVFGVAKHVKDQYRWSTHDDHSIFGFVMSSVEAFPAPQFVVMLMVYMALRRLDTHPPAVHGPFSWFCHIISYALRRWALILSIVGVWLYIYLAVIIEEVPLPNIGKNPFLYLLFSRNRLKCAHGKHLLPTIFLVHEATHAYPSICHNIGIFEMCFHVDVVLMAILLLLPKRLSALLSAVAYVPLARCSTLEAGEPLLRTIDYLPVGLLTIAIANGLPRASALAQSHWILRLILGSLALAFYGIFGFTTELQVGQLAVQLGVSPWVLRSLPLLLGTVMLLRLLDAQASSPGSGWSMLSALGRLCGQINISHLFVLQIHQGYATGINSMDGELVHFPASPSLFLWLWAGFFLCSAAIATILFLFVEAPVQALLGRSDNTARRRDYANGTTNGHVVNGHEG